MNLYAYVGNDPVNMLDPTGKFSCSQSTADYCIDFDNEFLENNKFKTPLSRPDDLQEQYIESFFGESEEKMEDGRSIYSMSLTTEPFTRKTSEEFNLGNADALVLGGGLITVTVTRNAVSGLLVASGLGLVGNRVIPQVQRGDKLRFDVKFTYTKSTDFGLKVLSSQIYHIQGK